MSEACQILHERLSALPRFSFDHDGKGLLKTGIYIVFDKNEPAHSMNKIVHIGTRMDNGSQKSQTGSNYFNKNKNFTFFRKHIGCAILKKRNDPFFKQWLAANTRFPEPVAPENRKKLKKTEQEVTDYIMDNLMFSVISKKAFSAISDLNANTINQIKSRLLSTINACPNCAPSQNWLGAHHPDSRIRNSGLWNAQNIDKTPLSPTDLEARGFQADQTTFSSVEEKTEVFQNQPITNTAYKNKSVSSKNPTRGPAPSASSKGGIRSIDNPAVVYAFQFGDTEYWKVGKTNDINRRFDEVTKHVPEEYLGQNWKHAWEQEFPTETDAFKAEQRIFDCLAKYLTKNERIKCSEKILLDAWEKITNY